MQADSRDLPRWLHSGFDLVYATIGVLNWIDDRWGRLPIWAEVPLYVLLAFLWAIPFRRVFHSTGK